MQTRECGAIRIKQRQDDPQNDIRHVFVFHPCFSELS
jgi:hypothetical protein